MYRFDFIRPARYGLTSRHTEKGFMSLETGWLGPQLEQSSVHFRINPDMEPVFEELLDELERDSVKTVFLTTPMHTAALKKFSNRLEMAAYYGRVASERNISYFDHSVMPFRILFQKVCLKRDKKKVYGFL